MPMIVADELEADWKRVRVVQATGDEKRFGNQDTDGSRSTRHFFEPDAPLRRRRAHHARGGRGRALGGARQRGGGEEPRGRAPPDGPARSATARSPRPRPAQPVPARDTLRLKDPSKFRYIGKGELKLVDGRDIVTGKAQYGIDTRLPGMLYAVVARPPVYGGKVASFDAAEALKVPGVVRVVQIEASPAPAAVQSRWAASRSSRATPGPPCRAATRSRSSGTTGRTRATTRRPSRRTLEEAARKPGKVVRNDGDFDAAAAARREAPRGRVLHPAPGPRADGAAGGDGAHRRTASARCGAASSHRRPRATCVAKRLGMSPADVTVHVTLLGGGFGRKSKPDFAIEAAVVSKAMDGKPVKVTWTRDDDLHHTYFHTVSVEHLEAGVDAQGKPVAWLHRSVAPTHHLDVRRRREARGAARAGHGRHQRAVRDSQRPHREPGGHRAHAHRLVPLGLEHPARVRGAVVRRRAGRGGGPRPEGLPAGGDRPARAGSARRRWPTPGTTASRPSAIRWTPAGCGASWRRPRARRGGAGRCPRAAGSASPRTTAS